MTPAACPCRKHLYQTREAADDALRRKQAIAAAHRDPNPVRSVYSCPVRSGYHLSKQTRKQRQKHQMEPGNSPTHGLRRTDALDRTQGLRHRSTHMQRTYVERRALVAGMLAEHPWCQARIEGVCVGRAVDVHELWRRSQGGDILNPDEQITACRPCHEWVTREPRKAEALRLSRWRWRAASEPEPELTLAELAERIASQRRAALQRHTKTSPAEKPGRKGNDHE